MPQDADLSDDVEGDAAVPSSHALEDAVAAVEIGDAHDAPAVDDEEEQQRLRLLAEEEERRADATWRALCEMQQRKQAAAAADAQSEAQANATMALEQHRRRREQQLQQALEEARERGSSSRDPDEPDASGWSANDQAALEAAMRLNPARQFETKALRWQAIANAVPGKTSRECVARCRQVQEVVRKTHCPLLQLDADLLVSVLAPLSGSQLCDVACVCKALCVAAHDEALWLPFANALPSKWAMQNFDPSREELWKYTLRIREGLHGAWRRLTEHRSGKCPYLRDIGKVERGRFIPDGSHMDYRVTYGAICELVMLQAREDDGLSHRTYKAVAERLVALSANPRSAIPPDLHMVVREIYKTCYPGFGSGTGSGAYAPGLQAGGSSTKAGTSGTLLGKGVATMTKKVQDEDLRKRLETKHVFNHLVPH